MKCKYCGHKGKRHYGWCIKATLLAALFLAGCTLPAQFGSPAYYDQLYGHYVAYCETHHLGTAKESCYQWASRVLDVAKVVVQGFKEQDSATPPAIYADRPSYPDAAFFNMPASQPWIVNPLPQPGSGMGFMCREAINRGDSGAVNVFCR